MLTAIGDVMRRCYERGWITTRDGNCSVRRTDDPRLYITPSAWRKTIIYPEHVIRVTFGEDGEVQVPEGVTPSAELHMHVLLQRNTRRTRAVLHTHPTHVVAAHYRGFDMQAIASEVPELFRYTRVGPSVPAIPATTRELGQATAEAFGVKDGEVECDIVTQANHGVCSVAPDPWAAYEHIERLDHVCEIVLASGVTPAEVLERSKHRKMQPTG
jgi:L-fuculose-phosphate aldolase